MKKSLAALFLTSICTVVSAQSVITGIVKSTNGSPVPSASVTVQEPGKETILAFGITNSKGEYRISVNSSQPNLVLKIKAYNFGASTQNITNKTQTVNFTIQPEVTEIEEVKIKTRIITKKGDTITYDLKSFENKSDRSLSDVLKKIPGIEVNSDGSVLYQGNAISKFYVEGKDLMEGGYGIITKSLPKDAVSKVEVLENHQPVKILQDKIASDQAAINIKLKKSVTMTGRGEVSSGFADPWLWNVKLTPMFFGKNAQWVLNYKTNNTGETVENEGNMFGSFSRWEGRRTMANQSKWLSVENASTPSGVNENRYLYNNVHYLSGNILLNPFKNKEWELKANANYTNNVVTRESYSETNNFQFGTHYENNFQNHFFTDKLKGELIFTKNAKKGFFKNTTSFTQFWNSDRAVTSRQDEVLGSRYSEQGLESPTTAFQNSLSTIIPWKEKMVNLTSYINYKDDSQTLDINPASYPKIVESITEDPITGQPIVNYYDFGTDSEWLRQKFRMKTLNIDHSANVSFTRKSWTFTPEVGFNYATNAMTSNLFNVDNNGNMSSFGDTFINDLKFTNSMPFASLGLNFKNENWMLFANAPFNFNHISAQDPARMVDKTLDKLTFEPNAFIQYSFASYWKASVRGSMNYSFGSVDDMYAGYIMSNPSSLNFMSSEAPIIESKNQSAGSRIEYRNPLNNLFFNVNYNYNVNKRNIISNYLDGGVGMGKVEYLTMDNESVNQSVSVEVGKYFPKFKSNMSVSYAYSNALMDQMRNNQLLTSDSDNQRLGFKFNNAYFSWLSVDYNMNYNWRTQSTVGRTLNNNGYQHNLAVFVYPIENHTIGFNWDQVNTSSETQKFNNGFFDLSYQYSWASKKIDFELKWLNIANKKVFETYSLSQFSESISRMQLRPSQVMLTVKFNFK